MTVLVDSGSNAVVLVDDASTFATVLSDNYSVTVLSGTQGIQGIQGNTGASGEATVQYAFSWGDAVPVTMLTTSIGTLIHKIELLLLTPFDVASTITIGDSLDNSRLFSVPNLDLSQAGTYQTNPNYTYSSATPINLYMTLGGGNSTGNGKILIYSQEA